MSLRNEPPMPADGTIAAMPSREPAHAALRSWLGGPGRSAAAAAGHAAARVPLLLAAAIFALVLLASA